MRLQDDCTEIMQTFLLHIFNSIQPFFFFSKSKFSLYILSYLMSFGLFFNFYLLLVTCMIQRCMVSTLPLFLALIPYSYPRLVYILGLCQVKTLMNRALRQGHARGQSTAARTCQGPFAPQQERTLFLSCNSTQQKHVTSLGFCLLQITFKLHGTKFSTDYGFLSWHTY